MVVSFLGVIRGFLPVAALAGLAVSGPFISTAQAESWASAFRGSVVAFQAPLNFRLDCCDGWLSLGLVERIPEKSDMMFVKALEKRFMSCTAFEGMSLRDQKADHLVWCNVEGGQMVSEILIEQGLVKERCELSGNQFGTC